MTGPRSSLDRLEARLEAQTARIDELYRLLHSASPQQRAAGPRRRTRRGRGRVATRP
jgi:hypothetical protein